MPARAGSALKSRSNTRPICKDALEPGPVGEHEEAGLDVGLDVGLPVPGRDHRRDRFSEGQALQVHALLARLAGRTTEPAMERALASQLSALAFPKGGLVPDDAPLLAQEGRSRHDDDLALLLGPGCRP